MADDAEASEFWEYFGGFGTISAQTSHEDNSKEEGPSAQLYKYLLCLYMNFIFVFHYSLILGWT